MDAIKFLSTLVAVVFLVSGAQAQFPRFNPFRPPSPQGRLTTGRGGGFQAELDRCKAAGLKPCFGEVPVRCYSEAERCNGPAFCRQYRDDELGCGGSFGPTETQTFTIEVTSTATADTSTSTTTTTSQTTSTTSSLTTSTLYSVESSTSIISATPTVGTFNSMATASLTMDFSGTYTAASAIPAGNVAGPGNACLDYAAAPAAGVAAAPANIFTLSMGNFLFTGTLMATAICSETTVSV